LFAGISASYLSPALGRARYVNGQAPMYGAGL
jgi:hypothetical protein